jgi:hypothetical protein
VFKAPEQKPSPDARHGQSQGSWKVRIFGRYRGLNLTLAGASRSCRPKGDLLIQLTHNSHIFIILMTSLFPDTSLEGDLGPNTTFSSRVQRVAFLHAALQKASVPSLLIPITNGGHGSVSHPEVISRAKLFIGKTLRGTDATIDTAPIPALPEVKKQP